ncbi:MAG: glycosyltransferase family 4 protein [Acidobacteria bacterium]|nr:glycosyltransferase family 4 protein [Acidobacteriota bacterium]
MKLRFLTSTPRNIREGSGTFAGISTLRRAVEAAGAEVEMCAPETRWRSLTAQRLWFNRRLKPETDCDATIGFDMDGFLIAGRASRPHIASIKGVIADEMRHERGVTRRLLGLQAACERLHVQRADAVFTTSRYAAQRIQELYGISQPPSIVPELIHLAGWRELFQRHAAAPDPARFTVLCVCRFYPRKRVRLLLEAAARLRPQMPHLQVRIVGRGPEEARLHRLSAQLQLGGTVHWLGDVSMSQLAGEYLRADLFCLPSVQEGFGIVFLEAMAAGKPILAARAAAAPEVLPQGLLVEPDSSEALADGISRLGANATLRRLLGEKGRARVEEFDAPRVAARFLDEVRRVTVMETAFRPR